MVGCHHWLGGPEFEQALGVGDGQGSLVCSSPWGCKESDTTEPLNWTETWNITLKSHFSFQHSISHNHMYILVRTFFLKSTKAPGVGYGQGSRPVAVHGVAKSQTRLSELNWLMASNKIQDISSFFFGICDMLNMMVQICSFVPSPKVHGQS